MTEKLKRSCAPISPSATSTAIQPKAHRQRREVTRRVGDVHFFDSVNGIDHSATRLQWMIKPSLKLTKNSDESVAGEGADEALMLFDRMCQRIEELVHQGAELKFRKRLANAR